MLQELWFYRNSIVFQVEYQEKNWIFFTDFKQNLNKNITYILYKNYFFNKYLILLQT